MAKEYNIIDTVTSEDGRYITYFYDSYTNGIQDSSTEYVPTEEEKAQSVSLKAKTQLIEEMHRANALRDDVAWQAAKDEYDLL